MEKYKRILWKLLYPHVILTLSLTSLSTAGLCYVFLHGLETRPIAYVLYLLSAYTLCVLAAALPPVYKSLRKKLYGNVHAARYLTQSDLRIRVSLYNGTVLNLAYALFKLFTGVFYRSVWFGAVGLYYMVLCLIRYLLMQNDRKTNLTASRDKYRLRQWYSYRTCGWLLLLLNAAMTGMSLQMVWQNKSYAYPGYVIYAAAAYTFYRLAMAIIRAVSIGKESNPVFAAAKAIDLSVALMSLFALQTAMFAAFGADTSDVTRRFMNACTGGTVCFVVLCIAVFMLFRSGKTIKALRINIIEA